MTAPDPRLDEIQARLAAATPGPWETTQAADEETTTWIEAANGDELHHDERGYGHMRENFAWMKRADAEFIANAPADVAYLLAELRKAREALARVSDWAGRNRTGFYDEAQDDVVQIIRAAVAAAKGDGE